VKVAVSVGGMRLESLSPIRFLAYYLIYAHLDTCLPKWGSDKDMLAPLGLSRVDVTMVKT